MDEELFDLGAPVVCKNCNTVLQKGQRFCHNCGLECTECDVASENTSDEEEISESNPQPRKKRFDLVSAKSLLVLTAALLMLIASFVPIVGIKYDIYGQEVKVKFNALDGVAICLNSMISLDSDTVIEDQEELAERYSDYSDEWENGKELNKLSKYVKKLFYLQLRSEETRLSPSLIIIALFSLAQIMLSILLTVFAALSGVSLLKDNVKDPSFLSFLFMGLNAVIVAANAYSFKFLPMLGGSKITFFASIAVIFAFIVMICFFLVRVIAEKEEVKIGDLVKHSISLVFAIIMLFSCSAPVVSTEVKTLFANKENAERVKTTLDASVFSKFGLSADERDEYAEMSDYEKAGTAEVYTALFNLYTKREFKNGEASVLNEELYAYLLLCDAYDYCLIFSLGAVAMVFVEVGALMIIWKELYELALGKKLCSAISLSARTVSIIMALAAVVMASVMSFIVTNNADALGIVYRSRISYGPILALIFGLAGMGVTVFETRKK